MPEQFRQEHDEIAWRKAAGMRDVLIHNYDDVNTDQIWLTITQVIPPFKDQIVRLLEAI